MGEKRGVEGAVYSEREQGKEKEKEKEVVEWRCSQRRGALSIYNGTARFGGRAS